jgi:hypothetical protein
MLSKAKTTLKGLLRRFPVMLLVWLLVLSSGFGSLIAYQMRAGIPAVAPGSWPTGTGLSFDPQHINLIMFAHPRCPCTDASLEELKVVLTRGRGRISPTICFFDPAGLPANWVQTGLFRDAKGIPGLNVIVDLNGSIAAAFGAMTSGQVLVYDGKGRRLFAGGITGSRGHAGDNRGRALVLALAAGDSSEPSQTPVFGCALHEQDCTKGRTL